MRLRALLLVLIVAATGAFVVGVSIERGDEASHHEASSEAVPASSEHREAGADAETAHGEGEAAEAPTSTSENHEELRPLGIDVEAWPFVAAAALASLALAVSVWLRPTLTPLLVLVAATMVAFAVLDIREVFHQADINESGLAVLAGTVAALHLAAAAVAAAMASRSRSAVAPSAGAAGTMAA
jgi:Flp pilus assembly protein TadB